MNYFDKNVHRNNHQLNKTIIKRSAAVFELATKFTSWVTAVCATPRLNWLLKHITFLTCSAVNILPGNAVKQ